MPNFTIIRTLLADKVAKESNARLKLISVIITLFVVASCDNTRLHDQASHIELSPPGLDLLSRMIDTDTLNVRIVLTINDENRAIDATRVVSTENTWSASFIVPMNTPFSLQIIWSVEEDKNSVIDYAGIEKDYGAIRSDSNIEIAPNSYDYSNYDSDGDGTSNYQELLAGDPVGPELQSAMPDISTMPIKTLRFTWQEVTNATHYRLLEKTEGQLNFTQVSSDLPQGTLSYDHTVPLYELATTQYVVSSCVPAKCVNTAPIFLPTFLVSGAIGYIKASNTDAGDSFGDAISISDNGGTMVVGAPGEESGARGTIDDLFGNNQQDDSIARAGAAYVFTRSDNSWNQQAYIKSSNTDELDNFGSAISVSGDGNTLAIAAIGEASDASGDQSNNTKTFAGAVYLFVRTGSVWTQQAYLKASNPDANDQFGSSVSLNDDGNILAVGATGEASAANGVNEDQGNNSAENAGAVYLFTLTDSVWTQQAYLKASNSNSNDFFGNSVSLSGDGNTLAIGATGESSNASGINPEGSNNSAESAGAVYVFSWTGSAWVQQAYLKASNSDPGDGFGRSVSLNRDGNTLATGATGEDSNADGINGDHTDNFTDQAGAAYVFTRINNSWTQQAYIKASNSDTDDSDPGDSFLTGDSFGVSVTLDDDGDSLAVGASGEASSTIGINNDQSDNSAPKAGAVYIFTRTENVWTQKAYIKASNSGTFDLFGDAAISGDGNSLAVAASNEDSSSSGINSAGQDDDSFQGAGAVYLY